MFLTKEIRKVIEKNMSKTMRNFYKKGGQIVVKIKRGKWLKKWGDEITLVLAKNGKVIKNDLYDYFDLKEIYNENDIIGYFVYGDKYDYTITYEKVA